MTNAIRALPDPTDGIIGNARLIQGDCLEVMTGWLKAGEPQDFPQFAAVITDPPYEAEAHKPQKRPPPSGTPYGDAPRLDIGFAPMTDELRREAAALIFAHCAGWALIFCQVEAAGLWRTAMVKPGGRYRRTMIWVKTDAMPQMSGNGPAQGYECISTSWCGMGRSTWNGGGKLGVYTGAKSLERDGHHPTEKPIWLMQALIADFTQPGDTILDPFMGSGTTGVAAIRAGRKFVGIEKDPEHYATAVRRMRYEESQLRMLP